jgi:predicted N-acetyltransferase YhbS
MFSKIAKFAKIQSLYNSSCFFNATTAHFSHPLLFKAFPNQQDKSSSFVIKQLEEKEIDEAAKCISDAFSSREMITKNYKIHNDQIVYKLRKDLEKALEQNLCFVCKDKKSGKLAGVVYYEDLSDRVDPEKDLEGTENLSKAMAFYKYCYSLISSQAEPKERNDVLMLNKLAVAQEFTRLGVASNLLFAGRYIHPRTTKAKKSLMIVSNEKTCEYMMKHGWELTKEINVKDYGKKDFSENGKVYLMKYEPKYVKTLIQELKSFFED